MFTNTLDHEEAGHLIAHFISKNERTVSIVELNHNCDLKDM